MREGPADESAARIAARLASAAFSSISLRERFFSDINADHAGPLNYARADRLTIAVLWVNYALLAALAAWNGFFGIGASTPSPLAWRPVSPWAATGALALGYAAAITPGLLKPRLKNHYAWRAVATAALLVFSFLLVFVSGGTIEMHFHFFIMMAYVCVYADWRLVWLATALVFAHHAILNATHPEWLFVYGRTAFGVAVHTGATLAAAAFMTLVCRMQRRSVLSLQAAREELEEDIARTRVMELALRDSNAFRGAILESALDPIVMADHEGRILEFNPAAERTFGYARMRVLGRRFDETLVPPSLRTYAQYLLRTAAEDAPRSAERREETLCMRDGGGTFPAEITVARVQGSRPPVFAIYVRDLTTQKRVAAEVEVARRQAAQHDKMIALGSLVSGVWHEIRTPLTYLQNNLYLLRHRVERGAAEGRTVADARADLDAPLDEALAGVDRVNGLVGELRRFTRVEPGERVEMPLNLAVHEAVDLFRATHRGRVRIEAELRPTRPVLVDKLQVQQVVLNLLANAAEATASAGSVRVGTRPAEGSGGAMLVVEDDGPGMTPEVRARIFEPLFTTKAHGTGLGLSIVKRIVDGHGAFIACETTLGKGTRFTVTFPAPAAQDAPADAPAIERAA